MRGQHAQIPARLFLRALRPQQFGQFVAPQRPVLAGEIDEQRLHGVRQILTFCTAASPFAKAEVGCAAWFSQTVSPPKVRIDNISTLFCLKRF